MILLLTVSFFLYLLDQKPGSLFDKNITNNSDSKNHIQKEEEGPIGRWTREEHQRFLEGYRLYGKNWRLVQKYVGVRSISQIRSHAQKYFAKLERIRNSTSPKTQARTPISSPYYKPHIGLGLEYKPMNYAKNSEDIAKYVILDLSDANSEENMNKQESSEVTENCHSELPAYPQIPFIIDTRYDCEYYMCTPWERELNIENFQKRLKHFNQINGSKLLHPEKEEEVPSNVNFAEINGRFRTLSSIFE